MPGNVAAAILHILAAAGVTSIYGVSGDAIFPLLDALAGQDRIHYYGAVHENNAAFMASYAARVSGRLAVCAATSGPGAVGLLNGLADAYFDRAPVLAITGQVDTAKLGTNAKQFFHQRDLLKTFAALSETVVNPQALVPVLSSLIKTAVDRKTVVHLAVPRDVFLMPLETGQLPAVQGKSLTLGAGLAGQLETAVGILTAARRVLVVVGVRNSSTASHAIRLAAKLRGGIVVAQQARGIIPDDEPAVIGGIGEGYVPPPVQDADAILIIGGAPYELKFLPEKVPLIQIGEDPGELHYDRITCALLGPAGHILKTLTERVDAGVKISGWTDEIREEKVRRRQMLELDAGNNQIPVHPARLAAALNAALARDAVIVEDIGSMVHWFERGFTAHSQTVLISGRWRSMGCGLPGAIGAKVAAPRRQVVVLAGDGGFMMSMNELITAVRCGLDITVVVAVNRSYNLEEFKMQAQGLTPFGYRLAVPDFKLFAESCGARGFRVEDPGQLATVLTEALNCGQVSVIEVMVADTPLPHIN